MVFQALCSQISRQVILNNSFISSARSISLTAARPVKEVIEHREGNTLIIDAVVKDSDRKHRLYKPQHRNGACPLCALGLDVKHTDVLILEQFMRPNGAALPRRITGLCKWQQRKVCFMIAMAIQAGLLPTFGKAGGKFESDWYWNHTRFNSYFDEDTIQPSKHSFRLKKRAELERAAELALAEELP